MFVWIAICAVGYYAGQPKATHQSASKAPHHSAICTACRPGLSDDWLIGPRCPSRGQLVAQPPGRLAAQPLLLPTDYPFRAAYQLASRATYGLVLHRPLISFFWVTSWSALRAAYLSAPFFAGSAGSPFCPLRCTYHNNSLEREKRISGL